MKVKSYRELIVWQKAVELVVEVYRMTNYFPRDELFGLISQIRRCAVSIPSNIAEGRTRGSRKEFRQFLLIAFSSGAELETQIEISRRIYSKIDYQIVNRLLTEVMSILNKMISVLK